MEPLGRTCWAIAEGYIPRESHDPAPQMTSHETVCLLNTSQRQRRRTHHDLLHGSRSQRPLLSAGPSQAD